LRALDRYLANTVTLTTAFTVFGLLGVITVFSFMEEIQKIENEYHLIDVAAYIAYTTPRRFYELIPYAAMIGALLGLGTLANNSELIVMRASGVSIGRISLGAMVPAVVMVLVGLAVGEYVVPVTERIAQHDRERAISGVLLPESGYWYREGNTYMHFGQVEKEGILEGVTHYVFDDAHKLIETRRAARAVYHDVSVEERYWLLEDIVVTEIADGGTRVSRYTSRRWDTSIDPDLLRSEILIEPDKLAITDLRAKVEYMDQQGLNSERYKLAYWQKSLQPLATIVLVFVAITFVFGPLREVTMGLRVVAGLIIGIIFKFLQDILTPASMVFGFEPVLATLVPIGLSFVCGVYLLKRVT